MQTAVSLIDRPDAAAALLQPARLRILQHLREPDSAAGVARALGMPRQRIGYHVRELEREGLLNHIGDRRKGNCVERLVQATARHYLIAPQVLGALGATPQQVRDRFSSSYLVAVAADTIRTVAALRERAEQAQKQLPTLTLQTDVRFRDAAAQHAFAEELASCIARLTQQYHDGEVKGGRTFRFSILGHPAK
ncbi:MAG: winged helix-turn-helix domain-containing protein [Gemmatimonadales bacterium]